MTTTVEQALRQAADMFHEVGMAIAADDLLADSRNAKLNEKLRENQRSPDHLKRIAADGHALCTGATGEPPMILAATISTSKDPLHLCANYFHGLLMMLGDRRTHGARIREVSADGFELCVRELARLGATDVMIHECGERDMEEHW